MMETNKQFDEKLLNGSFNSHADANKILTIESIKKHKAHLLVNFGRGQCSFQTHIVCVTGNDAPALQARKCSYLAVIKRKRNKEVISNNGGFSLLKKFNK